MMEQGYEDRAFFAELNDRTERRREEAKARRLKYKERTDKEDEAMYKKAWKGIRTQGDWQHPVINTNAQSCGNGFGA